ncbi:hybrid sensor histidine kinase/response regulator [Stutzerimonas sp. NM35]
MSRLLLLLLLLSASLPSQAGDSDCRLALQETVLLFEDPGGALTVDVVSRLPAERFQALHRGAFPYSFSYSAFWLRLQVRNPGTEFCHAWLQVGEPRLEQVQVFQHQDGQWHEMRAGSVYPLPEWSVQQRQPLFPLLVMAGEEREVMVRVASRSLLAVAPRLHSEEQRLRSGERASLIDGVVLGIMLLIVPFGLIVGVQIRSMLLLANALSSLAYLLLTGVVNGYLFYLPALLPWSRELVGVLSGCAALLFMLYIGILFQVPRLPPLWRAPLILYSVAVGVLLLGGTVFDFVGSRNLFSTLRWGFYMLVPLLCLGVWWHGLRLSWLGWALTALLVVQGLMPLLFLDGQPAPWSYGEDQLDLASGLMGAVLLFFTLISEFTRTRRDARLVSAELEALRAAEQQHLESTVARRTEQLRESLKARSALLARISHDLRSPLSGIINYTRLINDEGIQDYPQRIERNARLQLELIDELLEFSRGELSQEELVLAPGYLYGFLHEIGSEAHFLAQRQGNRLDCQFATDLPLLVQADFRQLRRVLVNLLGNASKFTREGLIVLRVENLGAETQGFSLRFSVADNGIGLTEDVREQLLRPFQRGGNVHGVEGFGLGLAIVDDLLRQMDSTLAFEDRPGGGTLFSFVLRVQSASEEAVEQVFHDAHATASDGAGRRILLVEDVELTREFLGDLIAGHGYDVTLAGSGEEALASIAWADVDLVITDQFMSGMDGWALLREVRRHRPGLPVLLYSASPARAENNGERLRFDAELLKPVSAEELLSCIERLCGQSGDSQPGPIAREMKLG